MAVYGARPYASRGYGDNTSYVPLAAVASGNTVTGAAAALIGEGLLTGDVHTLHLADADLIADGIVSATANKLVMYAQANLIGEGIMRSTAVDRGSRYRVVVTDKDGTLYGELEQATVSSVGWKLNDADDWSFSIPSDDPKVASVLLAEKFREVQIWRGDRLLVWGPVVRVDTDLATLNVSGFGAMWWLKRRSISRLVPLEYVMNGSFESGISGWTPAYSLTDVALRGAAAQSHTPANETALAPVLTGKRSLRLENDKDGADAWIFQSFEWTVNTSDSPTGDTFVARGYVWIEGGVYQTPAYESRGLVLERFSTTELWDDPVVQSLYPGQKKSLQVANAAIDDDTPKDQWVRLEVEITAPANGATESVVLRLYAPHGVVFWDGVSLTRDETLNLNFEFQSTITQTIVELVQDPDYGWTDLNIDVEGKGNPGPLKSKSYRFAERISAFDAVTEFSGMYDGQDVFMTYTPTRRIINCWSPRYGSDLRLELHVGTHISGFGWAFDGEQAATASVILGEGNGSDREMGVAVDVSEFSSGVVIEDVQTAVAGTPIDSLDKLAVEALHVARHPEIITAITPDLSLLGRVMSGDTVAVIAETGDFSMSARYRIVGITLDAVTKRLTLNMNRRDDS